MHYRRAQTPGATYFFTVVTYQRQHLFHNSAMVELLRSAIRTVNSRLPFIVDATVVLPDHLHCIWTLPDNDADFSTRWRLIKSEVSHHCPEPYKRHRSSSRLAKR